MDSADLIPKQIDLFKQRGLHKYLDRDIAKFKRKLERVQELTSKSATQRNFAGAYYVFYKIFDAVPLLLNNLMGMQIYRSQTNNPNELFNTQSRISYNKTNTSIIPAGKFNASRQPMFYGSLPYIAEDRMLSFPAAMTACLETCKPITDPAKTVLLQDFTIGTWKIINPISVANLAFDETHLSNHSELRLANHTYLTQMKSNLSSEAGDFVDTLFTYFSCLCRTGRNESAYYVLTAFFEAIRAYYRNNLGYQIKGLISSSAATEGRGLNIVMTPEAVDEHLLLSEAHMERFFLVMPEAVTYCTYPCTEVMKNLNHETNFNYTFSKYIPVAERFIDRMRKLRIAEGY